MLAKLKTVTAFPLASDFGEARAVIANYQKRLDHVADCEAGLLWHAANSEERESDRFDWIRSRIASAFPDGLPRQRRLNEMYLDALDARHDAWPAWRSALERVAALNRDAANKIAIGLQREHQASVRGIGRALSDLSAAISAECEIRQRFLDRSPERAPNRHLPDCAYELALVGTLGDPHSNASAWLRRMRALKLLD